MEQNISESQYLFDKQALQLAEKFFDIEDTSLLKVGTFGYATSLFSKVARDGVFHRDMLFNEIFLVSANLNSTVYNWAKILDENVDLASPSQMDVALKFNIEDLERASRVSLTGGTTEFNIGRSTVFDVGGYSFLLPYGIKILFNRTEGNQLAISANYDFNNYNYKDPKIKSPYLKVIITNNSAGEPEVTIACTIFQLEKRDWVFTISSNDILDVGIIEQLYGENLVNFRVDYSNSSTSTVWQDVETIFNEIDQPKTSRYTYYTFIGGDTLRLSFSNKPGGFRPEFNSRIKLETFTTTAEEGNFSYSSNIVLKDPNLENVNYICLPLSGKATGGASVKSFTESKIALMEKIRTRDNYTTSYDLEAFFKRIRKTRLSSDSKFTVVKVRDDIIKRHFSMFILQKNKKGDVVPTNTVDLNFSLEEISALDYSLKPGTLVIYDRIESTYRVLREDELAEPYLNSPDTYIYCIPFLINFDFKEFPKANIYLTNYKRAIDLRYLYYNANSTTRIIINNIEISRNPLRDIDKFNISCYLNSVNVNFNDIKVRLLLFKDQSVIGYADMSRQNESSQYLLEVTADDTFDQNGNYLIEEVFTDVDSGELIPQVRLDGEYELRVALLNHNPDSGETKPSLYSRMSDINEYEVVAELLAEEPISFAEDLTDIMYCELSLDKYQGKMKLTGVPLIGAQFYLNSTENEDIMNDMYSSLNITKDMSSSLENNTSIDVKFYNTSGLSRYYNVDTIDLRMKFNVSLNVPPTKTIEVSLKEFIAKFIEDTNEVIDKRFSISNLIKSIEQEFVEVKYIEFISLNGTNVQSIKQVEHIGKKTDMLPEGYVPEYLSVRKKTPRIGDDRLFDYSIDLNFI